ncbi:MAG: hypothetical protein AAFV33_07110 [Chloroflexota bacterium]
MRAIRCVLWIVLAAGAAACGSVSGRAEIEALSTENIAYATEAANIRSTLTSQETQVMSTSVAAETLVARENAVNAVILSTVRAGDPPTVAVVAAIDRSAGLNGATPDPQQFGDSPGGEVVETYVAGAVRDADGCGDDIRSQFPEGTSRLYAIQRVQNIPANTLYSVEFFFGGSAALSDDLVVTVDEADLCIWFFLEPYSMGTWSAQFYSNGVPVGERVNFTVGG